MATANPPSHEEESKELSKELKDSKEESKELSKELKDSKEISDTSSEEELQDIKPDTSLKENSISLANIGDVDFTLLSDDVQARTAMITRIKDYKGEPKPPDESFGIKWVAMEAELKGIIDNGLVPDAAVASTGRI